MTLSFIPFEQSLSPDLQFVPDDWSHTSFVLIEVIRSLVNTTDQNLHKL